VPVSPCAIFGQYDEERRFAAPHRAILGLRRFLCGLDCGLCGLLRLLLGGELLLDLSCDSLGVHLISRSGFPENGRRIAMRYRQQNTRLNQQPRERSLQPA